MINQVSNECEDENIRESSDEHCVRE